MAALAAADGDGDVSLSLLFDGRCCCLVGVKLILLWSLSSSYLFSEFSFSEEPPDDDDEDDDEDFGKAILRVVVARPAGGALLSGPPRASDEAVAEANPPPFRPCRCDRRRLLSIVIALPPSLWAAFLRGDRRCIVQDQGR